MVANILEVLNKTAIIPGFILLVMIAVFLCRKDRNQEVLEAFISATAVLIFFLILRFSATILWYVIGQHLLPVQMIFLIAILGMISGLICMIRAATKPYYGNMPWLVSIAMTLSVAFVLML